MANVILKTSAKTDISKKTGPSYYSVQMWGNVESLLKDLRILRGLEDLMKVMKLDYEELRLSL